MLKLESPKTPDKKKMAALLVCHGKVSRSKIPHLAVSSLQRAAHMSEGKVVPLMYIGGGLQCLHFCFQCHSQYFMIYKWIVSFLSVQAVLVCVAQYLRPVALKGVEGNTCDLMMYCPVLCFGGCCEDIEGRELVQDI
jgi:hypothetical protein